MKTPIKRNIMKKTNSYRIVNPEYLKQLSIIGINILIFLLLFNKIIKAQSDVNPDARIMELQVKLNELNASLAAINNENTTNEEKKEEEKNIVNDNSKVIIDNQEINKNEKPEQEEKEKKDIITGVEYAKEKKKADWIIMTIDNGTHKDRKSAINQILTIKDQGLRKKLGEKLIEIIKNEAELEVRIKAITVAGEIKLTDSVPSLINLLNNETEDVCVAAVYALKRIGDQSAKPALIAKLKEQKFENNSILIEALIDTLGEFKAAELSGFASETIKDIKTNQLIRELLVLFLGKTESIESKDTLLGVANDEEENEQIRAFAVNSLANLKITESIPDIEKITQTIDSYPFNKKKKYYNLYIYCIAALVKLGDENAFPMFLNVLRSDNAVVRLKAVQLVKEAKDKRTIDMLKYKMNYDPSPKVQSAAKSALKELGVDVESIKKENLKVEPDKQDNSIKEDEIKNDTKDESIGE